MSLTSFVTDAPKSNNLVTVGRNVEARTVEPDCSDQEVRTNDIRNIRLSDDDCDVTTTTVTRRRRQFRRCWWLCLFLQFEFLNIQSNQWVHIVNLWTHSYWCFEVPRWEIFRVALSQVQSGSNPENAESYLRTWHQYRLYEVTVVLAAKDVWV